MKKNLVKLIYGRSVSLVPVCVLLNTIVLFYLSLASLFQGSLLIGIKDKPPPTLVELADGTSIRTKEIPHYSRSDATISLFVEQIAIMLFSVTGKTLDAQGNLIDDRGTTLNNGKKVTNVAKKATAALSTDFRADLLNEISSFTPQDIFSGGKSKLLLNISSPTRSPKPNGEGKWIVDLVASLHYYHNDVFVRAIPFNKQFYLRAVKPPSPSPLPLSPLEKEVYEIQKNGLQIYFIQDLPEAQIE